MWSVKTYGNFWRKPWRKLRSNPRRNVRGIFWYRNLLRNSFRNSMRDFSRNFINIFARKSCMESRKVFQQVPSETLDLKIYSMHYFRNFSIDSFSKPCENFLWNVSGDFYKNLLTLKKYPWDSFGNVSKYSSRSSPKNFCFSKFVKTYQGLIWKLPLWMAPNKFSKNYFRNFTRHSSRIYVGQHGIDCTMIYFIKSVRFLQKNLWIITRKFLQGCHNKTRRSILRNSSGGFPEHRPKIPSESRGFLHELLQGLFAKSLLRIHSEITTTDYFNNLVKARWPRIRFLCSVSLPVSSPASKIQTCFYQKLLQGFILKTVKDLIRNASYIFSENLSKLFQNFHKIFLLKIPLIFFFQKKT